MLCIKEMLLVFSNKDQMCMYCKNAVPASTNFLSFIHRPMIISTVDTIKTLKLRIKDKHASALAAMAREVNQVWNYLNELSHRSIRERQKWLSAYDLQKYTAGFSKCEDVMVGSATVQLVCE